ncbi:GGDEF domain-containing protein [Hansschlegelia quercus]|uniref:diguanylate cyclase n=1 Tax=Hansschlegelia quercus TaxID=2528245 RepID=A0A4Q9GFV4_9HYPH|nr:sensor domain-containing diguanylate cyclase [Hansschlegelia quercus]TBN51857.1 sensor domain-containing diguanylate cyclase [Hansschlegelia quercus]
MSVVCPAPSAASEDARLGALLRYDVMDTPAEQSFDRITRLAQKMFRASFVTVSLLDGHRQWFKSKQGLSFSETPRSEAFCDVTIRQATPLVVPDARADPAYASLPLVTGEPFIRFYAGAPLRTPEGYILGALCVMDREPRSLSAEEIDMLVDLSDIVVGQLQLRQLADTDPLTGALSRRAFRDLAARELSLSRRYRRELALLTFDLDYFKSINDTHGHAAGDDVLVRSVDACKAELRNSDSIARLGGEEFAVLLPHTGAAAARDVAERLRRALGAQSFGSGRGRFHISASFGVASTRAGASDLDNLLRRADEALYRAKAKGRDRCETAPDCLPGQTQRSVAKRGRIVVEGVPAIDCTVRGLSNNGANLEVLSAEGLPASFVLALDADGPTRSCRVLSRAGRRLEVAFG